MNNTTLQFPDEAIRNITDIISEEFGGSPGVGTVPTDPVSTADDVIRTVHVDKSETPDIGETRAFREAGINVKRVTKPVNAVRRIETSDMDCVVADYNLPRATGIDLLDAVRDRGLELPFVLFTSDELDRVMDSRLSRGLTDYLQKGGPERYRLLANRVRNLTSQYRMRNQYSRNEKQFEQIRELFEFAVDAATLYFWDWDIENGTVRRYPRTEQLYGVDKSTLEPVFDSYTDYVYPDHREELVSTLRTAIETSSSYQIQYALELPARPRVWIEERGTILQNDNGPTRAVGANIDITQQKERQRELEWERNLNRTLHEALVESRTRAEIERTIVNQLHEYGYALAWIGDLLTDELEPTATAGQAEYVDDLTLTVPGTDSPVEPTVRAINDEQTKFIDELLAGPESNWRQRASEAGLKAEAALPLLYGDVFYGVLAVYDDESAAFDQTARRLLTELSDTLAFVIHSVERENALASDRIINATLQLVGAEYYLSDLIRRADCETNETRIVVHETIPYDDDRTIQYVSVNGTSVEVITEAAAEHPTVDDVSEIESETNTRIQLTHRADTPESMLTTVGTRVRSTSVTAKRADILIEVPNKETLRNAINTLEASNEFVSVLSSIETDRSDTRADPLEDLTDRQTTVLQAAYHRGYFEQPRESSATEVAESLGISHPTFLEHLRLAQQKLYQHELE